MKTKTTPKSSRVIRRSFALPGNLLEEANALAPKAIQGNANRLVRTALEEFVAQRRRTQFAEEMARMAVDPQIIKASRAITEEFLPAESDGLDR